MQEVYKFFPLFTFKRMCCVDLSCPLVLFFKTTPFKQAFCPISGRMVQFMEPLIQSDDSYDQTLSVQVDMNPLTEQSKPRVDLSVSVVIQGHVIQLQPQPLKGYVHQFFNKYRFHTFAELPVLIYNQDTISQIAEEANKMY